MSDNTDPAERIADLHLETGAGWKDDGRTGFVEKIRQIIGSEHGAPFELVIPCESEAEAIDEKADLHAAVEARALIRRLR